MDYSVDTSQMLAFAGEVGRMPAKVDLMARAVTIQAGKETAELARELISAQTHAEWGAVKHYPESITSEVLHSRQGVTVEVGPEVKGRSGRRRGGQGSLGHLLENGTPTSPPNAHLGPAFEANTAPWLAKLDRILSMVG